MLGQTQACRFILVSSTRTGRPDDHVGQCPAELVHNRSTTVVGRLPSTTIICLLYLFYQTTAEPIYVWQAMAKCLGAAEAIRRWLYRACASIFCNCNTFTLTSSEALYSRNCDGSLVPSRNTRCHSRRTR